LHFSGCFNPFARIFQGEPLRELFLAEYSQRGPSMRMADNPLFLLDRNLIGKSASNGKAKECWNLFLTQLVDRSGNSTEAHVQT
jgi:hypothetical protein